MDVYFPNIFQLPFNREGLPEKATYAGVLRNSQAGQIISGYFYTESLKSGSFLAKQLSVNQSTQQVMCDMNLFMIL